MEHFGAEINDHLRIEYLEDLQVENIVSADGVEDKFWYVLNENEMLVGCIGVREYRETCRTGKIYINQNFTYINSGRDEKQAAIDIFLEKPHIKKIPVLDQEGRLLYEYVKSMDAYYDELEIQCGINIGEERKEKIVVSLTSYGKRLDTVYLVVKSIMHQTLKADEIILYIAEADSKRMIEKEDELTKAGLKVIRNVKDLKPHKKYFYSVQNFPESIIITVDDDVMYDDRLIEELYTCHLTYPDAVICSRGHRMTKENGKVASYSSWETCVRSAVPEKGICATGAGGILYPCGQYRKKFIDEEGILKTSLCGDDLWLKAIELMEGVSTFAMGWNCYGLIKNSQETALGVENVVNKKNDEYLDRLGKYFNVNFAALF